MMDAAHKHRKTRRILAELLRSDIVHAYRDDGMIDCLTEMQRRESGITDTAAVSSNPYPDEVQTWIEQNPEAWVLDCGAGSRSIYYDNIVNFEIVAYPSTDVLGVGEALPFRDACFDFVVSNAVLEHVKDPFRCAREIIRVLKPGGKLYCAAPFLNPFHAYPHHYYNMTYQGLKNLFDDGMNIDRLWVPQYYHPMYVVSYIVGLWTRYLDPAQVEQFLKTPIGDFFPCENKPAFRERAFNKIEAEQFMFDLGSATALIATKLT